MAGSGPFWPDEEDDPFRAPVPFAPEPVLDLAAEFAPVLVPVPAPVPALPADAELPFAVESPAGTPLALVLPPEDERPSNPDRVLDP